MARILALVMLLFMALLLARSPVAAESDQPPLTPALESAAVAAEALVRRVVDGQSLDAYLSGNRTFIGYLGAQSPYANQPCGREALARNRELVADRVLLEEDPTYLLDEHGRRLYYAYTRDGVSIDETLVREGLAWAVRGDARYGAYLAALQAEAEAAGRGCLWDGSSATETGGAQRPLMDHEGDIHPGSAQRQVIWASAQSAWS